MEQQIIVEPFEVAHAALLDEKLHLGQHVVDGAQAHSPAHEIGDGAKGALGAAAAAQLDGGEGLVDQLASARERIERAVFVVFLDRYLAVALDQITGHLDDIGLAAGLGVTFVVAIMDSRCRPVIEALS